MPLRKLILESGLGGITWHYYSLNPIRDIAHLILVFLFLHFSSVGIHARPKALCGNHIHQKKTPDLGDHHDIMYSIYRECGVVKSTIFFFRRTITSTMSRNPGTLVHDLFRAHPRKSKKLERFIEKNCTFLFCSSDRSSSTL